MKKTALMFLVILSTLALLAGCGGGGGGTPSTGTDITPPSISASVTPPGDSWSSLGGDATISATVTDAGGVASVTGTITASSTTNFTLTNTTGSTYQKVVTIPANLTSVDIKYTVVVTAKDNAGNTKSDTVTFTIPVLGEDTTPPSVSANIVLPSGWSWLGGDVTINATVTDAGGVKSVSANVTPDIGAVGLDNTTGSTYQATISIPPNIEATAVTYTVVVTAEDNAGNTKSMSRTFSIPAIDIPPPPT